MKKWTYLAVAGMLLGSAPVFTGCVDTDEPWGVEQLRGAKAELLKAKAAVEQANAAIKQAQVAYVEAQTREKNAIALQQEMLAEKLRLENEWKQLENDEKRAEVEKRLAEIEQEMEAAALDHEKNMIDKQAALEEAKRQYEIVMQQIAISEAIGSEQARVTLESLKAAVQEAYDVLYADQTESGWWGQETVIENSSLEDKLYEASEKLYDAIQNQKKGYDTGKNGQVITDKEYWPATLEAIVAQYEAVLEVEQTALDKLIAASELPTEETDWRNQVDAMGKEIDALKEERDQKQLAIKEAQAAPEYISAWQKAYGVFDEKPSVFGETEKEIRKHIKDNNLTPSQNGTMQLRDEAKQKLNKAKKDTDIKIAAYSLPEGMEVSDRVMQALRFTKPADGENRDYFSYGESTYKWLDVDKQPADSAELPQDIQWYLQERYDKWLEPFETAIIPANEKAQAEAKLTAAKKAETAAQTAYDAAVKNWQAVLDITSAQKDYTEIDKTTFQTAVNTYKNAYTALNTAITKWNNALQTAYDEAKTAKETELKNAELVNAFNDQQIIDAFAENGNAAALGSIKSGWAGTSQDRAALTSLLNLYCQPNGQTSKADVIEALEGEFDAYITEVTGSRTWQEQHEADIETAAKKGVTDFKTEDAGDEDGLAAALATAKTNLQNAYDNTTDETKVDLVNAVDAFKESAIGFAQSVNATALNAVNMVKAANTTAVDENWYTNDKNFQETGVYTYKILNSNIEDKEVTDATTVKFNPNWENVAVIPGTLEISFKDGSTSYKDNTLNALEYRSYLAFGLADRYVAPERDEVENIDQITFGSDDTTGDSKAEILYAAKADVERQEAIISAQDDLKKLQETLTAAKTAFEAQVAADYKENFGELQAAYTTAENNHTATVDALAQVEEKLFGELDAEIDKLTAQIKANQTVYNKLKALAWKYLGITWPAKDPNDTNNPYEKPNPDNEYDPASFEADLKEAIAQQQRIVAEAEQDVQEAKVNLEQANSGEYDGVHYFQFQLDKVQREWDRAYAAYQEAMENLEKAMAIIAENGGSTEEEQPAE